VFLESFRKVSKIGDVSGFLGEVGRDWSSGMFRSETRLLFANVGFEFFRCSWELFEKVSHSKPMLTHKQLREAMDMIDGIHMAYIWYGDIWCRKATLTW